MSKPIVTDRIDGYDVTWQAEKITILVTRLQQHISDGRVTGEIKIKDSEGNTIWPETGLNFTASQTRTRLAKTLADRDSEHEWLTIINQLTLLVIALARRGEPVQELWTRDNVPDLEFLLEPVIIKGVPNVVFGDEGVTKSTMSLVFYMCLTLPWIDNPLGFNVPSRSIKTLILDYELPGEIAQRNVKQLQEGMGLPHFPLFHRRCKLPLASEIEQIANLMADTKAECVIVDSLARASGGDLNKTEPANAFFEALDKLETTSLIIAQTSKPSTDSDKKTKTIFGSALYTYYARNIMELCKSEVINDNEIDVALFHRKSNLTRRYPDMSYRFTFNEHRTIIEKQPINVAEFIQKVSLKKAIMAELRRGKQTSKDIADSIGGNENSIKTTLTRLKGRGLVMKLPDGLWGLPNREK